MSSPRRIITSSILKLYGFKYDEESKMWIKRYELNNAYVTVTYKYDWNARKLYCKTSDSNFGWLRSEWEYNNEVDALRELKGIY